MSVSPLDEIVRVAAELRDVLAEIERLNLAAGGRGGYTDRFTGEVVPAVEGSEAAYKKAWLLKHAASTGTYGRKRTVDEHKTYADLEAFDEWSRWNSEMYELRSAKERAHSYRQILSALQTAARVEADLAR